MGSTCTCDDPDIVVVRDRNMAFPYVSGNPYSRYCKGCKQRHFCSKTHWENADQKHVIPEGESEPVHVDDYEDENYFECPKCGNPHFGFPDDCACGADYEWPDEAGED